MEINIEFGMDYVVVEGVRVTRPGRVSRSQWLEFWEDATDAPTHWELQAIKAERERMGYR